MTNKEAKEKLYMEWQKFLEDNIDYAGVSEAYKMAFKALEQEPKPEWEHDHVILKAYSDGANDVLDKIRAEIEEAQTYDGIYIDRAYVLEILDRYKTESEG